MILPANKNVNMDVEFLEFLVPDHALNSSEHRKK